MNIQPETRMRLANRASGGVLIEIVIAVALFVGAAGFTLGAMRGVFDGMEREDRRLLAVDLARSLMAELEAGSINLADLRGPIDGRVGSLRASAASGASEDSLEGGAGSHRRWRVETRTERSRFTGLSLVEITVREVGEQDSASDESGDVISVTLRALMPLRESAPEEYQQDDLVEDLPEVVAP
jgi:hypothetical protein